MSDDVVGDTPASAGMDGPKETAGLLLRRAREAAGLHVAALAVSMKVPVKKLELLEADRLDLLPDAVFVRALASSVCRTLKIDAAPVLKLLPQTSAPRLDTEERGINTPFHAAGDFKASALPAFLTRPTVLWVAALLLGVLVVAFFPESGSTPAVVAPSATTPKEPATPVANTGMTQPAVPAAPQISVAPVDPPKPVEAAKSLTEAAAPMPMPVASKSGSPVAPIAVVPTVVAAAPVVPASGVAVVPNGLLMLKAKGETWVEVTDAKGVVQVRKILNAGEVASASGALPLAVVIGRADVTTVEVRGQAFSLDAISKDNVARFEVK